MTNPTKGALREQIAALVDPHANWVPGSISHQVDAAVDRRVRARRVADAILSLPAIALLAEVEAVLRRLEPHLDAIVCYASTMEEHEPNRIAFDARDLLTKIQQARGDRG